MHTPKILLYKHKTYVDGTHPVIIQVVKNGKPIRKVLGRCLPDNWLPSKSRVSTKDINSYRINDAIENALKTYGVTKKGSLQVMLQEQIDILQIKGQVSRYIANKSLLEQLKLYKPDVDFSDIDSIFIQKYCGWLSSKRGNNPNTIREKMQTLGKVMSAAKKAKVILENPMEGMVFSKQKVIKSKLNTEEMLRWINHDFQGKYTEVRDLFAAMFFLRGIRIGDVLLLNKKNIIDGRIVYRELKTGKIHDVKIRPELQAIIDRWLGHNKFGYIFSFMKLDLKDVKDKFLLKTYITAARSQVTRYAKIMAKEIGIEKNVTPHTIRHSFSKLANSVIKNTTITKDLVGHSTLEIHEMYIGDIADNHELDGHADTVFNELKKKKKK